MDFIKWQLFGLIFTLITIVVLVTKKRPLYQAMFIGIIMLSFFLGKPANEVIILFWEGLIDKATLELVFVVGLVTLLSWLLKDLGFLEHLLDSLTSILGSAKIAVIFIPALIGIFPVMGGAAISAPLVDVLGDKLGLSKLIKTSVNMVFRHSVYYFSPFTSSLILLAGLTKIELLVLIKYMSPLGVISIVSGYYLYLHGAKEKELDSKIGSRSFDNFKKLLFYGAPLFISLALFVLFNLSLLISLSIGLLVALFWGKFLGKKVELKKTIREGPDYYLMLGIAGIMIFRFFLADLKSLVILFSELLKMGVPLYLLFIIFPFVIGWVSASFSITIGLTVPFLFPLLSPDTNPALYAVLLYASGFFSYFISPIHLCQIVSNNFFGIRPIDAYKKQFPTLAITFAAGLLLFAMGTFFINQIS